MTNIVLTESQMKYVLDYILNEKIEFQEMDATIETEYLQILPFLKKLGFKPEDKKDYDAHPMILTPEYMKIDFDMLLNYGLSKDIHEQIIKKTLSLDTPMDIWLNKYVYDVLRYSRGIKTKNQNHYCVFKNASRNLRLLCNIDEKRFWGEYLNKKNDILIEAFDKKYQPSLETLAVIFKDIHNENVKVPPLEKRISDSIINLLDDSKGTIQEKKDNARNLITYISKFYNIVDNTDIEKFKDEHEVEILFDLNDFLKQAYDVAMAFLQQGKVYVIKNYKEYLITLNNPTIFSNQLTSIKL